MKTIFGLFVLVLSSNLMAQTCYVDMVNRSNRVVATFTSYGDNCYEAQKECRKAIRMQPNLGGVDCVKDNRSRSVHQPELGLIMPTVFLMVFVAHQKIMLTKDLRSKQLDAPVN